MGRFFISLVAALLLAFPLHAENDATISHELEFRGRTGNVVLHVPMMTNAALVGTMLLKFDTVPAAIVSLATTGVSLCVGTIGSTCVAMRDKARMLEKLRTRPGVVVERGRVTYPDGFWIDLGIDPTVVEITHHPYKPDEYPKFRERMQRDIYDTAASVGLYPSQKREGLTASGGHLNLGLTAFGNDPLLFLNFVTDFANHEEIANGVVIADTLNARAFRNSSELREKMRELRRDWIDNPKMTFDDVVRAYDFMLTKPKNQALAVRGRLDPVQARLEMRSVPTFASIDEQHRFTELILARIAHLKTKRELIPFIDEKPLIDPYKKTAAFKSYVAESGKAWSDYLPLINPAYRGYDKVPNVVQRAVACTRGYFKIGY